MADIEHKMYSATPISYCTWFVEFQCPFPSTSPAHLGHSGVKVHILLYHIKFLGLLVSVDLTELSSLLGSDVSLLGYPSITQDTQYYCQINSSVYSRILSVYLECGLSYSHG